ncbi:hypothetical protein ISS06_01490 [Patescibacteria group bacterium]|nr:hypothetical protein [Patescibacteria group bacterium]
MKINVYSTETCGFCIQLKNFLEENNIEFNEFNVGSDQSAAKKMIEATGQMGVPVTEIDGEFIVGFDVNRLKEKLNL